MTKQDKKDIYADLHIHSKYSRACSKYLTIPNLEKSAITKGLNLLGTGDFTHPKWIEHLKEHLTEDDTGFLKTKSGFPFVLQSEVSLMYTQDNKGRKVHLILLAPNLNTVQKITDYLLSKGRIDYDGRPIFKIPCDQFTKDIKSIDDMIEIIPAHIWTPHFGLLGSYNQFITFEDCFKDQTKHIYAFETGLSSDPPMNWRVSNLDKYTMLSNSDTHSPDPSKLGREFNHFKINPTYIDLINAIRTRDGLIATYEVDPAFGKYHNTGHRNCNVSLTAKKAQKLNNICPKCEKPLIIGVENRIEEIADRPENHTPCNPQQFFKILPLKDLIAYHVQKGIATKTVETFYNKLIQEFKNEINILINTDLKQIERLTDKEFFQLIKKNRNGNLKVEAGYDGVFGRIIN